MFLQTVVLQLLSHVQLFAIKCIAACQASLWRRQWHPTPVLLPGESHGRRRLVGYSPWGHKESDTTERLHFRIWNQEPEQRLTAWIWCQNSLLQEPESSRERAVQLYGESWSYWVCAGCACIHTYVLRRLSRLTHLDILWTLAFQAAQSMGFSRQKYLSGFAKLFVSETIFKH